MFKASSGSEYVYVYKSKWNKGGIQIKPNQSSNANAPYIGCAVATFKKIRSL